jgi:alkylhydroperoxidase family enzyme
MGAIQLADTSKLTGRSKELLDQFEKSAGKVPNILKGVANSPAALEAILAMREGLSKGLLDEQMRHRIGITIAEIYSCEYLLASRVAMAKKAGMSDEELRLARQQSSKDPKADAGLQFVRNIVLRHAEIAPGDVAELKTAGYSDGEIVELIANTSFQMFAYYFIQIGQPEMDFDPVATAFPA